MFKILSTLNFQTLLVRYLDDGHEQTDVVYLDSFTEDIYDKDFKPLHNRVAKEILQSLRNSKECAKGYFQGCTALAEEALATKNKVLEGKPDAGTI